MRGDQQAGYGSVLPIAGLTMGVSPCGSRWGAPVCRLPADPASGRVHAWRFPMDGPRFDALARTFATTRSRRTLLRGLLGGAVGALVVGVVRDRQEVTAAPLCLGQSCVDSAGCCGGTVCDLDPLSPTVGTCQPANGPCAATGVCGSDTACCATESCQAGVCVPSQGGCVLRGACPAGDADCCGGEVCANGVCVAAAREAGCPSGQIRCDGVCVDPLTDSNNCGACKIVCIDLGRTPCVGGVCIVATEPPVEPGTEELSVAARSPAGRRGR